MPPPAKPSIANPATPLAAKNSFWKRHGQTVSTVLSLLVFLASPLLIRLAIDQYSGSFDAGTLNAVVLSTFVAFANIYTATRLFKWNWPRLFADSRECIEQALLAHTYTDPREIRRFGLSESERLTTAQIQLAYERAKFHHICVRLTAAFFVYFSYLVLLCWLSLAVLNLVPRGIQPPASELSSSASTAATSGLQNQLAEAIEAPELSSTWPPSTSPKATPGAPRL